jgi:hypothetical protein
MYGEDPLMPSRHRLPAVAGTVDHSDELPSRRRPFVLRDARRITPVETRHRTPSTQTRIPQPTHRDNRQDDDSYTVPDD